MYGIDGQTLSRSSILVATMTAASLFLFATTAGAVSHPAMQASQSATTPAPQRPGSTPQFQLSPEELGNVLLAEKHYQAAIEAFKKAPRDSATLWNSMGIAYQEMLNPDEAIHCYLTSLKLNPKNGSVLNNLGTVYVSFKDYRTAQHYYQKALKQEPKSAVILKNLGTDLLMRRKYKEGGQMYARAMEIDPDIFAGVTGQSIADPTSTENRGAMNYYMAKTCARAGMAGPAIDYLRKALNEGYVNPKKIAEDSEFATLRGIPAFEQLLLAQKNP
ncbi:MAG: tetratricopeptide repeat protein [Terracidiphilus sp.]